MIHTLLARLKPEYLTELNSNYEASYGDMAEKIKDWLGNTPFFDTLTIHQVQCLITFTNQHITNINQIELMYGSYWFYTNDEYEKILNTEVNEAVQL